LVCFVSKSAPDNQFTGAFLFISLFMQKKTNIIVLYISVVVFGAWALGFGAAKDSPSGVTSVSAQALTVYKSPTCGCCANYIAYLRRNGFRVETVETEDMSAIKTEHGIPYDMESCHTTVMGDYVVEGHIPVEVMYKLLEEKSAVSGIAMPGMPAGSPGMPGAKRGAFIIHQMTEAGVSEFMQL
jgi:hypothetical protein